MAKFWELLEKSVIVQGTVTLMSVGVACYLFITRGEIPDTLVQILSLILGFWFGTYSQKAIQSMSK